MNERSSWQVTTHDWGTDVDLEHLGAVRELLSHGDSAGGRRHLILEVLAYANEEAEHLGRVGTTTVTYHPDGGVTVADDGRGTDTRTDSKGRVIRKPVMATADVRFRDEATAPVLPDGLPRRGMSTVAALSRELTHQNHRHRGSWSQTYRYGIPDDELAAIDPRATSGTSVTFTAQLSGPADLTDTDLQGFPWLTVTQTQGTS
ncbi:ATP-binding protein [Ornithinimicrobium murale]|uniref:ATP-binding protein n=1 Tax=Ornithinimicrobium murale TaxID=1050153 RepID=UPI000E0DEBD1|nr:ATP-binding protein [Ornithinimicrobium murale]